MKNKRITRENREKIYMGVLNQGMLRFPFFVLSVETPNHIRAKLSLSSLNY